LLSEELDPEDWPHAGEFSASLQPCRLDQLRAQFEPAGGPGGGARRITNGPGRTLAYSSVTQARKTGECPVRVIRVGQRVRLYW
jgi:hypothetical protein